MKKILLLFIILISTDVLAFEKNTNFTFKKFEKAQQEGKTIVVNAWNKTCMTCAKQSKVFADAVNDFKEVEFFFYEQAKHKNIAKNLNIKFWTTIVVYKGHNEISRKIGLTKKEDIYQLINKGI
ncbi:thioredoxin family protein [Candidatus Pelagibacter sp.]|nr:thioredoxin family protein [Candidatus Pelagibacter sp.]